MLASVSLVLLKKTCSLQHQRSGNEQKIYQCKSVTYDPRTLSWLSGELPGLKEQSSNPVNNRAMHQVQQQLQWLEELVRKPQKKNHTGRVNRI